MNQQRQHAIEYLREENRVLRDQLGNRRLRFTDVQVATEVEHIHSAEQIGRHVGRRILWMHEAA